MRRTIVLLLTVVFLSSCSITRPETSEQIRDFLPDEAIAAKTATPVGEEGYDDPDDVLSILALSGGGAYGCLLYTSPSPRDRQKSRMPSSA